MSTKKVEIKQRHPALILLRIALEGHPVKLGDEEWTYADGVFGVVRKAYDSEGKEDGIYVYGVDLSVQAWIRMCEKASEQDIMANIASHVLTDINRKRRP